MRPSSVSIYAVGINPLPWSHRSYVHSLNSDVGAPMASAATQHCEEMANNFSRTVQVIDIWKCSTPVVTFFEPETLIPSVLGLVSGAVIRSVQILKTRLRPPSRALTINLTISSNDKSVDVGKVVEEEVDNRRFAEKLNDEEIMTRTKNTMMAVK
ncbi:hypothetical protein AgCh_015299 [Apium graveolens]